MIMWDFPRHRRWSKPNRWNWAGELDRMVVERFGLKMTCGRCFRSIPTEDTVFPDRSGYCCKPCYDALEGERALVATTRAFCLQRGINW